MGSAVQQLAFLSAYQASSAATQSNSNHLAAAAAQVQAANKYDNDIAGGSNFDRNLAAMMIARAQQQQQHQQSYAQMNNVESNDRGPSPAANSKQSSHMLTAPMTVPSPNRLAGVFRFYVQVKTQVDGVLSSLRLKPQHQQVTKKKHHKQNFNLKSILNTLVHVHGLQILKDGVYNADPHPGNVLVLPDGRLGLLDYGMVGRLSNDQRYSIANTIIGLYNQNKTQVANLYSSSGYSATMSNENVTDVNILHRFATFHLDKIDLSPLVLENGEVIQIMDLMSNTRERVIPPWVEEGRRLGGLLQGVCAQAARPISLAKEWKGIASQVVQKKYANGF